jgi:hypothetical protein
MAQIVQGWSGLDEGKYVVGTGRYTFGVSVAEVTFEGFCILLVKVDPGIETSDGTQATANALGLIDSHHTIVLALGYGTSGTYPQAIWFAALNACKRPMKFREVDGLYPAHVLPRAAPLFGTSLLT